MNHNDSTRNPKGSVASYTPKPTPPKLNMKTLSKKQTTKTSRKMSTARLILGLIGGPLLCSCASQVSWAGEEAEEQRLRVRTTAYTHTEADHLKYGRKTAVGTRLVSGKVNSAAADWSFLPLGTTFKISGSDTIYHVEDYGSALVGTETVDIYRPSKKSMWTWGVRHVDIEIIEEGDIEASIAFLKKRPKSKHCRKMLVSLQQQD